MGTRSLKPRGRPRHVSACHVCGAACETVRAAYVHCQQRGRQRLGYRWRNYETLEQAYQRRLVEIRSDPHAMDEIRAIADMLLGMMPEVE